MTFKTFFKDLLVDLYIFLTPKKRIREECFDEYNTELSLSDFSCIIQHGVTYKITVNKEPLFFRRCSMHLPVKQYILEFTVFFFQKIKNNEKLSNLFLRNIIPRLLIRKNLEKFLHMGSITQASPLYFYLKGLNTSDSIGIEEADQVDPVILKEWATYASAQLSAYRYNRFNGRSLQTYFALNDFAYLRVSELLKVSFEVPGCSFVKLLIEGDSYFGYVSENASGSLASAIDKEHRLALVSGVLQRKLCELNVLDYLCNVYDHGPYNYNVSFDGFGCISNVAVFDNDSLGGFPPPLLGLIDRDQSHLIEGGLFNRPFIGKAIYDNLCSLKKERLYDSLSGALPKSRIRGVYRRARILKAAVSASVKRGATKILEDGEWNQTTIDKELSGEAACSYLKRFVSFEHKEPI